MVLGTTVYCSPSESNRVHPTPFIPEGHSTAFWGTLSKKLPSSKESFIPSTNVSLIASASSIGITTVWIVDRTSRQFFPSAQFAVVSIMLSMTTERGYWKRRVLETMVVAWIKPDFSADPSGEFMTSLASRPQSFSMLYVIWTLIGVIFSRKDQKSFAVQG